MSSEPPDSPELDRPFARKIWHEAHRLALEYKIVIEFEDGEWYGRGLELPGAMSNGKTLDQCIQNTRESMAALVAYMIEEGQKPPAPAKEGKRTQQVNVRLSPEEKIALETAARDRGYKGLGDYLRTVSLERSIR